MIDKDIDMKISILLKGLPRRLEPVSEWWKHKFIDRYPEINFDFYCHFWNDNEIDLDKRIVDTFNPVKYSTDSYHNMFTDFMYRLLNMCKEKNHRPSLFDLVKKDISIDDNIDDILEILKRDKVLYNLLGQYVSSEKVINTIDSNKIKEYDLIILTRSDLIINDVYNFYNNMNILNNEIKNDYTNNNTVYPGGMRKIPENGGYPFLDDRFFLGNNMSMYNYLNNFEQKLFNLMYDGKTDYGGPYLHHNIWYILGLESKTNFILCDPGKGKNVLDYQLVKTNINSNKIIKMNFKDIKIDYMNFVYYTYIKDRGYNMSEEEIAQDTDTFVPKDDYINAWMEKNRVPSAIKKNGEIWFYP